MVMTTSIEFQLNTTRNALEQSTVKELRETALLWNIDLKGRSQSRAAIVECILENVRERLEAASAPLTPSRYW